MTTTMDRDALVTRLGGLIGTGLVEHEDHGPVVAMPSTEQQVADVLKFATTEGVVVRSQAGAPDPADPPGMREGGPKEASIYLDLRGLTDQPNANTVAFTVNAGAGKLGADVEYQLFHTGYTLGPQPRLFFQIPVGAYLAGPRFLAERMAWGPWESPLVGLRVAMPDGRLAEIGGKAPRTAAGPGLESLYLGGRDQLGVITSATLRVKPFPDVVTVSGIFPHLDRAFEAIRTVCAEGWHPAAAALFPGRDHTRWLQVNVDKKQPRDGGVLLAAFYGWGSMTDHVKRRVLRAMEAQGGGSLGEEGSAEWWDSRHGKIGQGGPKSLKWSEPEETGREIGDVVAVAPWDQALKLYHALRSMPGGADRCFGQFEAFGPGGATLRFTVMGGQKTPGHLLFHSLEETIRVHGGRIAGVSFRDVPEAPGGSVPGRGTPGASGEPPDLAVLRAVKARLDPAGVINPGAFDGPF